MFTAKNLYVPGEVRHLDVKSEVPYLGGSMVPRYDAAEDLLSITSRSCLTLDPQFSLFLLHRVLVAGDRGARGIVSLSVALVFGRDRESESDTYTGMKYKGIFWLRLRNQGSTSSQPPGQGGAGPSNKPPVQGGAESSDESSEQGENDPGAPPRESSEDADAAGMDRENEPPASSNTRWEALAAMIVEVARRTLDNIPYAPHAVGYSESAVQGPPLIGGEAWSYGGRVITVGPGSDATHVPVLLNVDAATLLAVASTDGINFRILGGANALPRSKFWGVPCVREGAYLTNSRCPVKRDALWDAKVPVYASSTSQLGWAFDSDDDARRLPGADSVSPDAPLVGSSLAQFSEPSMVGGTYAPGYGIAKLDEKRSAAVRGGLAKLARMDAANLFIRTPDREGGRGAWWELLDAGGVSTGQIFSFDAVNGSRIPVGCSGLVAGRRGGHTPRVVDGSLITEGPPTSTGFVGVKAPGDWEGAEPLICIAMGESWPAGMDMPGMTDAVVERRVFVEGGDSIDLGRVYSDYSVAVGIPPHGRGDNPPTFSILVDERTEVSHFFPGQKELTDIDGYGLVAVSKYTCGHAGTGHSSSVRIYLPSGVFIRHLAVPGRVSPQLKVYHGECPLESTPGGGCAVRASTFGGVHMPNYGWRTRTVGGFGVSVDRGFTAVDGGTNRLLVGKVVLTPDASEGKGVNICFRKAILPTRLETEGGGTTVAYSRTTLIEGTFSVRGKVYVPSYDALVEFASSRAMGTRDTTIVVPMRDGTSESMGIGNLPTDPSAHGREIHQGPYLVTLDGGGDPHSPGGTIVASVAGTTRENVIPRSTDETSANRVSALLQCGSLVELALAFYEPSYYKWVLPSIGAFYALGYLPMGGLIFYIASVITLATHHYATRSGPKSWWILLPSIIGLAPALFPLYTYILLSIQLVHVFFCGKKLSFWWRVGLTFFSALLLGAEAYIARVFDWVGGIPHPLLAPPTQSPVGEPWILGLMLTPMLKLIAGVKLSWWKHLLAMVAYASGVTVPWAFGFARWTPYDLGFVSYLLMGLALFSESRWSRFQYGADFLTGVISHFVPTLSGVRAWVSIRLAAAAVRRRFETPTQGGAGSRG